MSIIDRWFLGGNTSHKGPSHIIWESLVQPSCETNENLTNAVNWPCTRQMNSDDSFLVVIRTIVYSFLSSDVIKWKQLSFMLFERKINKQGNLTGEGASFRMVNQPRLNFLRHITTTNKSCNVFVLSGSNREGRVLLKEEHRSKSPVTVWREKKWIYWRQFSLPEETVTLTSFWTMASTEKETSHPTTPPSSTRLRTVPIERTANVSR